MNDSRNERLGWDELPAGVQRGVERIIGDTVVEWHSQPGGYSPGSADRVVTASGRRAFVKACSGEPNADTPIIHRREIAVMGVLPDDAPAPRLLGSYDDDGWVAIVLEDIAGKRPATPWAPDEIDGVLDSLECLTTLEITDPERILPYASVDLAGTFGGWGRLLDDGIAPPPGWRASQLRWLDRLANGVLPELDGDGIVHTDVRGDNILITRDGGVVFVDWPWAVRGQAWFDGIGVLVNVLLHEPAFDADAVLRDHLLFDGVDRELIDGVLAGLAGSFVDAARRRAAPGIPALREFQRRQGDTTLSWLRDRLDPRR